MLTFGVGVGAVSVPVGHADYTPWFAQEVGDATQVVSVAGDGGSSAKVDVFQRTAAGWQPVRVGIPAFVGSSGMAPETHDGQAKTPMGIFARSTSPSAPRQTRAADSGTCRSVPTIGGTVT